MDKFFNKISEFITEEQKSDLELAYYNNAVLSRCIELCGEDELNYKEIKELLLSDDSKFQMNLEKTNNNIVSDLVTIINLLYFDWEIAQNKIIKDRLEKLEKKSKRTINEFNRCDM